MLAKQIFGASDIWRHFKLFDHSENIQIAMPLIFLHDVKH
jgi:hypothetical protein